MNTVQAWCVLVLSVCLSGLWAHAEESAEPRAHLAADTWLGDVDAGCDVQHWQEASPIFQGAVTARASAESLHGVRTPLGHVVSRQLQSAQHTTSRPGAPDGNSVVMLFTTRFEHKQAAVETVTCLKESDGTWKAAGYDMK
jgi:Protein of unknown function (DUF4019)